ncbi:MAG: cytochrome c biogenesis CcdA family protein [Clostridia bacterium]
MIDQWLTTLGALLRDALWVAPFIALLAGILTSFTPCALSSLPLVIGYVGGYSEGDTRKAFRFSLVFAAGLSLTLTALGTAASLLGRFIGGGGKLWFIALGVLMVLMALNTYGIINLFPRSCSVKTGKTKGYFGAFLAGIMGGIAASPCATPVLIVLLALVAGEGNVVWGTLLLLLYSLGFCILMVAAGTSVGFVRQVSQSEKYARFQKIFNLVLGSVILLIAFYLFYMGF